jgi:hypothetical protein
LEGFHRFWFALDMRSILYPGKRGSSEKGYRLLTGAVASGQDSGERQMPEEGEKRALEQRQADVAEKESPGVLAEQECSQKHE